MQLEGCENDNEITFVFYMLLYQKRFKPFEDINIINIVLVIE